MRIYLYAAVFVLLVIYAAAALVTVDRRPADKQIASLVQQGAQAINDRDLGRAMSYVSESYEDEFNSNYSQLRIRAAQAFRDETRYHVTAVPTRINPEENEAMISCHVSITRAGDSQPFYNRDLIILLQQERGWHAWVMPVKVWRVTSIRNMGFDFGSEL